MAERKRKIILEIVNSKRHGTYFIIEKSKGRKFQIAESNRLSQGQFSAFVHEMGRFADLMTNTCGIKISNKEFARQNEIQIYFKNEGFDKDGK